MKKRFLSILLCFCMVLSLLPVPVLAASTHTLTVTGGVENVDYRWGGSIYKMNGESSNVTNVLVILTDKELTITGDTTGALEYRDVISINNGVTANLTLNGVKIISSYYSAGITIAPGGALNLILQGTNEFKQNRVDEGRGYNYPAIRVPEGASLTVTEASTGSLTSSTFLGSAVIGGRLAENCGNVTINGGIFDLTAKGTDGIDNQGGPAIGPGRGGNKGTIAIHGGYIKAHSDWGAAIGTGYWNYYGDQNEEIKITGGTVVATTANPTADGIGGSGGKAITGGVTITGGSVNTPVRNTRPKNTGGNNLYKAALTLHGAAEGTLVNSLTAKTASGISYSYNLKDIVADSSGRIYVWLPERSTVTNIIAGGTNYTGDSVVAVNDSETEIFYPESSTIKKYTLTTEINDGRIVTLSDIKCDLTIYDKTGSSEAFQNLPFEKDKNNPSRATVASYEFYTAKTDIQKINIALCSGDISWEKDVAPDKNVWAVNIGARLYKTMLIFRNEAVTTDIAVESVTIKQAGTQLEADKGEFYVPHIITKQTEGYGTMEAYLPENSSSTEISVKAASLNGGNTITKIGQTITADNLTSLLMLNKTSSEAVVFTDTLDISKGNITFEDASGDLKITYSDTSGTQKNVTTFFEGKYRITGSTTSNGIRVLSTGGTTLQLVLDNALMDLGCEYEQNPSPFNIEGESKVSLLLAGINKISSEVLFKRINSKAAICVKEKATLVIGGDGSLEASTSNSNYASVIGGSGWSQYYVSSVDHCGTIRIEGGDITLNGNKAGISSGYVGTGATGAVSNYGSFTMIGGNLKINSSDNAIGVKDVNITGGTIDVGDKTIYGDNSLSVAGGTIVAGNFNAGASGIITVTGGTMFNPNGEQTEMNKAPKNQTVFVYPVTADVSNIYGSNSAVSDAVITDLNYGFKDVKTDDNGVLHLYLPVNANTNTTFKGIAYQGAVSVGKDNILTIPCNHEQYTEDGYCTVCGSPQPAAWNEASSLYEISNAGQLEWFSKLVNGTLSGTAQNASANGKLLKDVTAGSDFKTIGTETTPYTGTFDGGGHTATLSIDKGSSSYQGLFGAVGGGATVKNVGAAGTVNGGAFTAGLIGGSSGNVGTVTIQNCWNEATVTGTAENAAGIFGCNASGATIKIENCYNIGAVSGNRESAGISGWLGNGATVTNCYNAGTVSGAESNKSFARHNNATFTNCYQLNTIGTQDSITAKTLDAFKSGEVTYLMNGSKSEAPLTWGQIIGKDTYPVFYDGNNIVYKIDDNTYSNSLVKLTAGNPFNITGESADIAVSGDAGATVYYVKSDTQLTDGNKVEELATAAHSVILQSDTATISLTNLTENTAYTYYMVAKVGNNYSKVFSVNFKTLLLTPTNSVVTVDYDNELLKSVAINSYTLEYGLQTGATDWKEVTEQGISLTTLLNDHSGTENINLYLRKKSGESISDEFAYAIPARPDCNVTELDIDYINETVKMPNTVKYQFSVSSPASWDLATNGTGSEVSLNSYISPAGTAVESLNKIYFRNPATESAFESKTASVTIPTRPDTPVVAQTATSITDSSVTLTVVTGAEYSKDGTNWQDSPEFTGLTAYADHIFYQRFKATGNSFSSAYSTETIKTDKQSITGTTVSLDKTNFIYNGQSQMPTVTVKLDEKTLIESTDYTVSYSNSNGNANDTTNVGSITVTVTAMDGSYLGTANSKPTYTIDKATLTPSISGTTNKEYDGDTTVDSGLSISLNGIQNNESVSATADFAYDNKNVDTDKTITASNITLSSDNGNYTLASETATADAGTITAKTVDVTISGDFTHKYDGNANYTHTATYNTIGSDKADVTIKYDDSTTKPYDVKIKDSNVEAYVLTAVINDNNYALGTTLGTKSFTISPEIITGTGASRTLLYTNTATQTASASDFDINKEGVFSSGGDVSGNGNIIESVGYDENVTYALKSGLSYGSQTATIPLIFTPNSKNYAQVKVNLTVSLADKGNSTAPEAFTLQFKLNTDGATYTATIPADDGTEYSFNGTDWSDTNTKTDVAPGTSVTGYIRMKETDDKKASGAITDTQTAPLLIVKTPTASPDGGIFSGSQTVTLTCETDGADIYYTTDGSTPSNSSTKYTAAFKVSDTTTVKAMAVKADMKDSEVMTVNYTKNDVSVSLDEANFIYNGKSQTPTVTVKLGEKTLAEGTDYTICYSNSNSKSNDTTNVGTITVTVTAKDGGYLGDFNSEVTYTIDKATLTPIISGTTSKEYDGDTTVDSGLSISLNDIQNSDSVSATADFAYDNKNVGTEKTITASNITLVGDNGNYILASETTTANVGTITAKKVDVTISGDSNYTYDGNANYTHTATYTTIGGATPNVTIKYDSSATKPVNVKVKDSNVEAYKLTSVINDNNYVLKDMLGTTSFTISPAVITANNASKTMLYTNTATQTASALDFDINKEGVFSSGGDVSGNINIINSVEYGENVTYALKSGLSYSSQTATIPLVFTPNSKNYAPVNVNLTVVLADKENGTAPEAFTLQFKLNTDGATYTATIPADDGTEYSFNGTDWSDTNTKTDVAPGTSVTGYIRMKETDDKKASEAITDTQTAPLLIVKTPTASPDDGIFSGSQTVTLTCETEGADIYYTTDGSTPTTSSNKYTIAFKVSDTTTVKAMAVKADMKDSEVMTVNYTKNDVSVSLDEANFIYNGKSQTPTTTVKLGEKTLAEGTDYTVSYSNSNGKSNDTTNVGTITVTVTAKDGGYFGDFNSESTYTIDKATLTPIISGTTSKEYDGDTTVDSGLSISLNDIQNSDSVSATADFAYDNKNVGTEKTITASNITLVGDNGNYILASETATANVGTITAKKVDVTISGDSNYTYDGNANYAHTATYTTMGSDTPNVTIKYDGSTTKPVDAKVKDGNDASYVLTAIITDNNYVLKDILGTTSFTISPAVITANNASKTMLYTNTTTQTAIAANFGINTDGMFTADGQVSDSDNILKSVEYGENVKYTLNSDLGYSSQFATIPVIFTPNSKNYTQVNVNLTVNLADKVSITTPSAFTLQFELNADGTTYTAIIPAVVDAEYSFNGINWSDINTKTDVAPGASVTGYIRMKETEDKNASDVISNTQTAPILIIKTPTASPDGGSFTGSQTITLACGTEGADIYYTLDGSTPTNSSTKYTEAFTLSDTTTVKAMAIKAGMKNSEIITVIFTKNSSSGNSGGGTTGGGTISINTNVTVLVSSDEGSVKATVTVEDNAAIVTISDKQIKEIASSKTKTGKIKLDASDLKVDTVIVPTELVSAANNDSSFSGLEVVLPTGSVTLDKTALNSVGSKGDVKISVDTVSNSKLTDTQKSVLGTQASSAVIVDVNVYVDDNKTSTFNNGKIKVSVHYTLKSHEKAENITVWFIKDDGTIEPKNGVYNSTTGCVDFTTEHLSQYLIVSFPFTDVAESEWCYASVAYAYNNGLFSGISENSFNPNTAMTRQMIWMVLARMDDKTPADMDEARSWAVENSISDGSNPISTITREQMAVILYRYATYKKYDTTQGGMAIREFADYDSISEYALTAMGWTVNTGLIQGSNNYIMSSGSTTRAQVATILMRFCQNVAK